MVSTRYPDGCDNWLTIFSARVAGMIIGEVPMFDEVIESVSELETRVNGARDGID